jgi:Glycosyltransferase
MRGKPRIAIVTPGVFPIPSETGSSVERVVHEFSVRLKDRFDFYVFGKFVPRGASWEEADGITYIRPKRPRPVAYLKAVCEILSRLGPDLIQVENRPKYALALKKAFPRIPVWLNLHSTTFIRPPLLADQSGRRVLSRADRIIVNSRYLRSRLPSFRRKPAVSVVYPGADTETFANKWTTPGENEDCKRKLGYEGKTIVLFAGRLIPLKGVHHLLNVWPAIVAKHPEALLMVIGSARYGSHRITPYVMKLHALGNRMPLHVRFIPFVPHAQMPFWYGAADIAVVPSVAREAFGLVNAEAMARGLPVIATDVGGIGEIVVHGESGFLLRPSRIERDLFVYLDLLLGNSELRREFGLRSASRIREHFTWEHTAQAMAELYARCLG